MVPVVLQEKIARSIAQSGYLRRSSGTDGHREWLHFCVAAGSRSSAAGELDLIVNLSTMDERARWTVLVCDRGTWDGDVEDIDARLVGGHLFAQFARGKVTFRDGVFRIAGSLRERPIAFELAITPHTFPSLASNITLDQREAINWFVVPRATATGWIAVGDRVHQLDGALAYHDHNWGRFTHKNFAWQWGHASSRTASVVLARLLDRVQSTAFVQSLLIWSGARQHRVFRGAELEVTPEGWLRPRDCLTIPRVASLLTAGGATEVPRTLHVVARGDGDELRGAFVARDVARIAVPDETGLGTTIIHEVLGRLQLAGTIRNEPFELDAPAVFEMLRSVR